jgi:hypothetical protein
MVTSTDARYDEPRVSDDSGYWFDADTAPAFSPADVSVAVSRVREHAYLVRHPHTGAIGVAIGGRTSATHPHVGATGLVDGRPAWPLWGRLPPLYPEWLGDRSFTQTHAVRFPYVTGAMANGIATTRLVAAVARAGILGFFGAAGLALHRVERAVVEGEAAKCFGAGLSICGHQAGERRRCDQGANQDARKD